MVDALVDTSIIVDLLRGYQPAIEWMEGNEESLGLTRFTWLEIIQGCTNKQKLAQAVQLLEGFELVPATTADLEWGTALLMKYHLKLKIDKIDCLIASVSYRTQLPLYTRNLKHFSPVLDDLAISPY